MEKLPTKKKVAIVRQYLSGFSYDEIAAKNGVSKGTVTNVVTELRPENFPRRPMSVKTLNYFENCPSN